MNRMLYAIYLLSVHRLLSALQGSFLAPHTTDDVAAGEAHTGIAVA
jgi:hypothetical protein